MKESMIILDLISHQKCARKHFAKQKPGFGCVLYQSQELQQFRYFETVQNGDNCFVETIVMAGTYRLLKVLSEKTILKPFIQISPIQFGEGTGKNNEILIYADRLPIQVLKL